MSPDFLALLRSSNVLVMFTWLWDYQIILRWYIILYPTHPSKGKELWFEYLTDINMFCDLHKDLIKTFHGIKNLKNGAPHDKDTVMD